MGWSDLEKESRLRYEGERAGYKVRPLSQLDLNVMAATELLWHQHFNALNVKKAMDGTDDATQWKQIMSECQPTKIFAAINQGSVKYFPCFIHPKQPSWMVIKLGGRLQRPEFATGFVQFVDEIPANNKPQNFQQASDAAKEKAHAILAAAQEIKRSQQTGIEVTATPLGAMADKAKQIHVAQITR